MQTLYDQIGGEAVIDKLISTFYSRVLSDPMLQPFFEHTSIEKLTKMQKSFFSIALGGPVPETEIRLYEAHRDRGIERRHLTRFTEHLIATLREIGIEERAAIRVYERIATYADEVLGDSSVDG